MDRQTDRKTDIHEQREKRMTVGQIDMVRRTDKQTYRWIHLLINQQMYRYADGPTNRHSDRQTDDI
jgi:hypothetical protein